MKSRFRPAHLLVSIIVAGALVSGVAHARSSDDAGGDGDEAPTAVYPAQELTPQILYQLMLAEIAAARGQRSMAAQSYLDLARRTRDARIARRAAELAVVARQTDLATEASRLWLELDPGSTMAQQLAAGTAAGAARVEELQQSLAIALARQGDKIGPALLSLNRGLARIPDKTLVRRLVKTLTEPYLNLPEAHFARANAAYTAGDPVGASEELEGALRLKPDWEPAVILEAQLQQVVSPDKGIETLRAYVAGHPDAREPRLALARILVLAKQFGPAREQFEAIIQRSPDDRDAIHAAALIAMQQGDRAAAEKYFRRLLDAGFSEPDTIRLYLGQLAEEDRRHEDAINWFKAVEPGPQYVAAQGRIAQVLAGSGHLAEARQQLQNAAREASPADQVQYVLLESQVLRDAKRDEESFNVLDEALRKFPDDPDLLYESALTAERIGHSEVMEGRLRKLIALKPDHAHAYNALGYSLVDRNERLAEAEALIRKGLALAPNDPFIIDSLGWAQFRRGKLDESLTTLQRAYALRADPEIAAHLGEVLWSLGRRDEAAKVWREAAAAHPDNAVLMGVIKKFKP